MYYHLCDHIYIAQFRDEVILLDLKQDKYTICFKGLSEAFLKLFSQKTIVNSFDVKVIRSLINDAIIEEKEEAYPFYFDRKVHSKGVENVDWNLPLDDNHIPLNLDILKAFLMLLKINLYIKIQGFYSVIQLIKKTQKSKVNYIIPPKEELNHLARIMNKVCLLYPTRTKCLEWAVTFVLLALKRGWKCNLEIGVQNYPFIAHAWVECDGKVIMDSQDLREGLGIILNEPFRKLTV